MISWTRQSVATGQISDAMGPNPLGYLAYHADGRMMAVVFGGDRPLKGAVPTDEEKAGLFDSMLAYSASYTLENGRVIHHVDGAWNPAWKGALIRPYRVEGNRLFISGAPGKDPRTGEEVIYDLEFEKV
ncbi:hypothetical protein J2Y48_002005 [Mycoplana sp. BE70]|uniref:lipocalin-like domain-containing protein n=1 Tax=Mycoplana sp. BE70 TaxID=2817775 RepID=UPI002854FCC4|nr:lipocalin-like domain-containing protein [Mycoplana sp. BE70]MDR6756712.1 hypothetical protein [Mycoplana sp. BE70]